MKNIYKFKYIVIVFALIILLSPKARAASANLVPSGQVIKSSLVANGSDTDVQGVIDGDLFCNGNKVNISGKVTGNVFCYASQFDLSGSVEGGIYVVAQKAEITGLVGGQAYFAVSNLITSSASRFRQDLSVFSSTAKLSGLVLRNLSVYSNSLSLDATVAGTVNARANSLTLLKNTDIKGDLNYSATNFDRQNGSSITGRLSKQQSNSAYGGTNFSGDNLLVLVLLYLGFVMSLLIVSMSTVVLLPKFYNKALGQIKDHTSKSILLGFVNLIITPILIAILALTVIGIPLAGLVSVGWVLSLMLSGPVFAYLVGSKMVKDNKKYIKRMLAGSLVVLLLYAVPIVNVLVASAVAIVGSGALVSMLLSYRQSKK